MDGGAKFNGRFNEAQHPIEESSQADLALRPVCSLLNERNQNLLTQIRFLTQMYARFWNDLADHASA